jgi:hypothetical protein
MMVPFELKNPITGHQPNKTSLTGQRLRKIMEFHMDFLMDESWATSIAPLCDRE